MKRTNLLGIATLVVLLWPTTAQLEPLGDLLSGVQDLLGSKPPATQAETMPGNGAEASRLPVNGIGRYLSSPPAGRNAGVIANGVPGIDGLNASSEAFHNALHGLDPSLIRAVLGETNPAVLSQITRSLTMSLPGLESPPAPVQTLPGIDGLPVRLR